MNEIKKWSACILAVVTLTACGKEEIDPEHSETDRVAVQFSANIGQTATGNILTRVENDSWYDRDEIGIFMVGQGSNGDFLASNIRYRTQSGDGNFAPYNAHPIYYPLDETQPVDFIAYFPYNANGEYFTVDTRYQQSKDLQSQTDLMYASTNKYNSKGYTKYDPNVNLVFEHQLSKFVIKPVAGQGITSFRGMTATLKNIGYRGLFYPQTGLVQVFDSTSDIQMLTLDEESYDLILPPQTNSSSEGWYVEFGLQEGAVYNTYRWDVPVGTVLEKGKEYIWEITIQKTTSLISSSIENWETSSTGYGTVN